MENLNGCVRCLTRRSFRTFQKKLAPFLPNSRGADSLKQFIVALTMGLEEKTQIEKRLTQSTFSAEKQRDQQTTKTPVSIKKRVNRFELYVDQSGLDENRQLVFFIVKEMFKAVETFHHSFWGRRHECSISRTATANPVL